MVQQLLLSALATCRFVMMHRNHPLSEGIRHFTLLSLEQVDEFIQAVRSTTPGKVMELSLNDQLLIYTVLDITCKAYLTDLGDEMEQMNAGNLENADTSFTEIRSTLLKGCSYVMGGMKENLVGIDEFDERVDILENHILVE